MRSELETPAPAERITVAKRLRRWAGRRTRQLLRALLVLSLGLALIVVGLLIWRAARLIGLRDVGDPFDVAAVSATRFSADRDAFVFFRQALAKLRPSQPELPKVVAAAGPVTSWSKADPKAREWLAANYEALDMFRRGADQTDGFAHPVRDETAFTHERVHLQRLVGLALLEGSRLEDQGDMEGAWTWYRAVLRTRAHIMRRGTVFERFFTTRCFPWVQKRVALWAADPKTEIPQLRRALDDAIATEPRLEWDSSSLKVEYLLAMRELDRPGNPIADDEDLEYHIAGERLPPDVARQVHNARRFLLHEPERSRRVLRLAFANWLAHCENPADGPRRPAVRASFWSMGSKTSVFFYAAGSTAPAGARALSPETVAQWLVESHDAKQLLHQWPWPSISLQERRDHRALVIALAEELYRRERGGSPPSEDALVGTYLNRLPDDGTAELDDGRALTVEETQAAAPEDLLK